MKEDEEAETREKAIMEEAFAMYDHIKAVQSTERLTPLIEAWHRGRASMGYNPAIDKEHVCNIECRLKYIDTICPQLKLFGCRVSGATHVCDGGRGMCYVSYTDKDGYHFCTFSGRDLGKTIVQHSWFNPNSNRPGLINCFSPIINQNSKPENDNVSKLGPVVGSSPRKTSSLSTPGNDGTSTPLKIRMGSPLRTPLGSEASSQTTPQFKTPFDAVGTVGGRTPRTPAGPSFGGKDFEDDGLVIASTPRRPASGLGLHSSISKSVPDYTSKTIKGKKRKSQRKRKASNPKRDVKRNDWALDVKRRALAHLKSQVDHGASLANGGRSEWEEEDAAEEAAEPGLVIPDAYNGICLFTVAVPLYRGYSQDVIHENPYKKGRRSRYAWMGGNFQIKHNSEIESRTDAILQDLLWDNKIKMGIYEQKLVLAKQQTLTKIEMYVALRLAQNPPRLPNYQVMRSHWLHTINDMVKEPECEEPNPKTKAFYRMLVLTLWAFMWEYIEVPAWREQCFARIRKLETSHVGVIAPNQTNIPVHPGVSHIQFTTGLLYVLKQDGIRLGEECVMEPDKWLQKMLPSTAELDYDLMTVDRKAQKTSSSKSKKTQALLRRKVAAGRGQSVNLPKRRRRRKKSAKNNQRSVSSYGRGKRSYTQTNVTEGRNYVKKGLLKLARRGHTENLKKAIEMCRQQAQNIYAI